MILAGTPAANHIIQHNRLWSLNLIPYHKGILAITLTGNDYQTNH